MFSLNEVIYLTIYVLAIVYYVVLGCIMLFQHGNIFSTHGELVAKRRMTRTVAILMFIWAFEYIIYLPPMLYHCALNHPGFWICFLTCIMLNTSMFYIIMHAVIQQWRNAVRGGIIIGLPFLAFFLWVIITGNTDPFYMKIAAAFHLVCIVGLLIKYVSDYRRYIERIRSEYSETTDKEVFWSWSCFGVFGVQAVSCVIYQLYWSFTFEIIYAVLSIANSAYICYCTYHQKTLDNDIIEEHIVNTTQNATETGKDENAFYDIIEHKLETLCEQKLLFLEPDLTRESLCLRLSIGRTYLSLYLHSRGITFYQYINSLRIEYAVKMMQENPNMSIREVSELSGFQSQTTFRKVFKEVMGCLPSDMKR